MPHRLPQSFYTRTDIEKIAKELLGKYLVTNINGILTSGMIVETEAYRGPDDKACHAFGNKRTKRTEVMFHEGGVSYVYLCYGIHHLFNVITAKENMPHAVLIRALEPIEGLGGMLGRRNMEKKEHRLSGGPGTLTQALGINRNIHNSIRLFDENSPIWLEDRGTVFEEKDIICSRRVGIDFADDHALWDWRFRVRNNPWTSKGKGKGE